MAWVRTYAGLDDEAVQDVRDEQKQTRGRHAQEIDDRHVLEADALRLFLADIVHRHFARLGMARKNVVVGSA